MPDDDKDLTVHFGITVFPVRNTKIAAVLLTLGVPFADPDHQENWTRNIYTEERPYQPGRPGEITYLLAGQTKAALREEAVLAGELNKAFHENSADKQLDVLVDEIERANPVLGKRLRKLLPLALAVYGRCFLENRERILDLWRKSKAMVLIRRSEKSFTLVPKHASAETRQSFGV